MNENINLDSIVNEERVYKRIDSELCGTVIERKDNYASVKFVPTKKMIVDDNMIIHYGFIFSSASFCAISAVNKPNSIIIYSEVKFLSPVELGNEIKASNCSSILPKQKNTLQDLLNKISSANRKIIALDGVENLTPSIIKEFYSLPLAAYYESTNIDNVINKVLMGEYSKFFDISTKNKNIYKIHSFYSKDSSNRIDFRTNIIDCNGNTVFSAKIDNESSIDRLKVRLYKSLLDYSLNQSY